jgi:hypothetical protein
MTPVPDRARAQREEAVGDRYTYTTPDGRVVHYEVVALDVTSHCIRPTGPTPSKSPKDAA